MKSSGYLELAVIQNGKFLKRDITTAAFGVVGLDGYYDQSQSQSQSVTEDNNAVGWTIESTISSEANNSNSSKAGKAYFRQTTDMPPKSPVYLRLWAKTMLGSYT